MAFSSRCLKIFLLCSPPAPRESRRAVECPAAVLREESAWCHPSGRCHPLSGTRETWVARFVAAFVIPIRHLLSAIRHLSSAIRHLSSAIRHLSSAISPSPFPVPNSAFRIVKRKVPPTFWHQGNVGGPYSRVV